MAVLYILASIRKSAAKLLMIIYIARMESYNTLELEKRRKT